MLGILNAGWRRWLRFAELFGNVQMTIVLSLLYWALLPLVAIPFKLLADPLSMRGPRRGQWVQRRPISAILEALRKQG